MCWEERLLIYPGVEEYFKKDKNFRARCREQSCQTFIMYVNIKSLAEFKKHIYDQHRDVHINEEKNKNNKLSECCRLRKDRQIECVSCDEDTDTNKFSSFNDLWSHVTDQHSEQYKEKRKLDWGWKYLKQIGDFSAKCKLCSNETEIIRLTLRINTLKYHIENTHCQIIESMLRDKHSWKYETEKHYFLNKCYTEPVNFQTKCRFCDEALEYIAAKSLELHMYENHGSICCIEKTENNDNWQYFRFRKQETREIECIICERTVNEYQMTDHIKIHSPLDPNIKSRHWTFKYASQKEDIVKCTLCYENIKYYFCIFATLKDHMQLNHPVDNNRIEKEEKFWKEQTKKNSWLQKCYTNDNDFRAKCKFCEYKNIFIKKEQFEDHLEKAHYLIYIIERNWELISLEKYETEKEKDQTKCIRCTNRKETNGEQILECMICQKNVFHSPKQFHLYHSPQELKFYSQTHWALKYAKQYGDVARCTLCENDATDINVECDMNNLKDHMLFGHSQEWKRVQEEDLEQGTAYDQPGPSTSHAN